MVTNTVPVTCTPRSGGVGATPAAQNANDTTGSSEGGVSEKEETRERRDQTTSKCDRTSADKRSRRVTGQIVDRHTPVAKQYKFNLVSQNVQKSAINTTLLLEQNADADIILVQEIFWGVIKKVASPSDAEGCEYHNTIAHPNFVCIGAEPSSRVATYINQRWMRMGVARIPNLEHQDVVATTMRNGEEQINILNIYNDPKTHAAISFLLDRADTLPSITHMAGDFNATHELWEKIDKKIATQHRQHAEDLIQLANGELNLVLANPEDTPTWRSNNKSLKPSTIDLVWVSSEIAHRTTINVDMQGRNRSDHAIIRWKTDAPEPCSTQASIKPNSTNEKEFVETVRREISTQISDTEEYKTVRDIVRIEKIISDISKEAWNKCAKIPNASRHSKTWWNEECQEKAEAVRKVHERSDNDNRTTPKPSRKEKEKAHRELQKATKKAKRKHFDNIIESIPEKRIWDLVDWTKPRRTKAHSAIKNNRGATVTTPEEIAKAFAQQFNPSDIPTPAKEVADEYPQRQVRRFQPITVLEIQENLKSTSNTSSPGPDQCTWAMWKKIMDQNVMRKMSKLFTACIKHAYFPETFKESVTVVIPKPNKKDYTNPAAYRPIVLLNCLSKLLEKIVAKRMQFESQSANITHPMQFGGTAQHSTTDAGIQLVHNIKQAWKEGNDSTIILLDIAQFYPSIDHDILSKTLEKQGFAPELCAFMRSYLSDRSTTYVHAGFESQKVATPRGLGQGSALSPILAALYIAPILHQMSPMSGVELGNQIIQFFVDDGLIQVAYKIPEGLKHLGEQLQFNNAIIANTLEELAERLMSIGLYIEQDKFEMMHFRRKRTPWKTSEPRGPELVIRVPNKRQIRGIHTIRIKPAETIRYLGFYLDPHLTWRPHVRHYVNKASSTVNAIRMLGNDRRGLSPAHKKRLYQTNIIPVLTYGAQLWWNPQWKKIKWIHKEIKKTQHRALKWITGAFRTTPLGAMETIAGITPIKIHIDKLMRNAAARTHTTHRNHPTRAMLPKTWELPFNQLKSPYQLKGPRKDANTPISIVAHSDIAISEFFNAYHRECQPGERVEESFASRIHIEQRKNSEIRKRDKKGMEKWIQNVLVKDIDESNKIRGGITVFTDGSVRESKQGGKAAGIAWTINKEGVRTAQGKQPIGEATAYDAEIIALSKAISECAKRVSQDTKEIHFYADNQAAVASIISTKMGPAQMHRIHACMTIREIMQTHPEINIYFKWCPGHEGINRNDEVDKLAKEAAGSEQPKLRTMASMKQMIKKQAQRERDGLRAINNHKGQSWALKKNSGRNTAHAGENWCMKKMGNNNSLMARFIRFTTAHAPIGEYRKRFHIAGPEGCACGKNLETRDHILYECPLWIRENISINERARGITHEDMRTFLTTNPSVATFEWKDMVEKHQTAKDSNERREAWNSIITASRARKEAWIKWNAEEKDKGKTQFVWDPDIKVKDRARR